MLRVAVVVLVGCAGLLAAQVAAVALLGRWGPPLPPDAPQASNGHLSPAEVL